MKDASQGHRLVDHTLLGSIWQYDQCLGLFVGDSSIKARMRFSVFCAVASMSTGLDMLVEYYQ